jgi:hypothetical protein
MSNNSAASLAHCVLILVQGKQMLRMSKQTIQA